MYFRKSYSKDIENCDYRYDIKGIGEIRLYDTIDGENVRIGELTYLDHSKGVNCLILSFVYINDEYKWKQNSSNNKKYGSALLTEFEKILESENKLGYLESILSDEVDEKFYEKHGWKEHENLSGIYLYHPKKD